MDNNDILIRCRYAMDIKNNDVVEIFKLGGMEFTREEVLLILTKSPVLEDDEAPAATDRHIPCTDDMLETFLNGYIVFKRGRQEPRPGEPEAPQVKLSYNEHPNNLLLKKLKIALSLTSEDMLDVFKLAGLTVTKGELGAFLRKKGHKNYKECGDNFARNFLKGLTVKYRGE
ncbi:DUF1456 family protein [Bacillus infantis]|uniref:DUF1456 family protein n=1 Tax=Bacillus infantis TaxID=324767 RepID=A0A5D4RFA1_9BACI|nr:DUF1456 family protein [Bacillus infantis]TYS48516.1 DUF1456 family protein [Bacillus infantis]